MIDTSYSSREFYTALGRDELAGSTCKNCGHKVVPARVICPECSHADMKPTLFSGKGRLAAYTVIHVPPTAMAEAGYSVKNPYCVGIVELEEGPRVSAQILDVDMANPDQIGIGRELSMTTVERGEGDQRQKFLAFK